MDIDRHSGKPAIARLINDLLSTASENSVYEKLVFHVKANGNLALFGHAPYGIFAESRPMTGVLVRYKRMKTDRAIDDCYAIVA